MSTEERLAVVETEIGHVKKQVEKLDNIEDMVTRIDTMLKPLAEAKLPERVADLESTRRFAKLIAVPVVGSIFAGIGKFLNLY